VPHNSPDLLARRAIQRAPVPGPTPQSSSKHSLPGQQAFFRLSWDAAPFQAGMVREPTLLQSSALPTQPTKTKQLARGMGSIAISGLHSVDGGCELNPLQKPPLSTPATATTAEAPPASGEGSVPSIRARGASGQVWWYEKMRREAVKVEAKSNPWDSKKAAARSTDVKLPFNKWGGAVAPQHWGQGKQAHGPAKL